MQVNLELLLSKNITLIINNVWKITGDSIIQGRSNRFAYERVMA